MTTNVDIVNRALQVIGTRTTVTQSELNNNSSNEAIQINLILTDYRDQLLRMAPWNCAQKYDNLIWLTSTAGTPENTSPATFNWSPGQPAIPWAYEYVYPQDCLRACWVNPNQNTGFASGTPITTAVTGGSPAGWLGQPIKFRITTDQFRAPLTSTLVSGGSGHQANDTIFLGTSILTNDFNAGAVPAGVAYITVNTVDGSGAILTYSLTQMGNQLPLQTGLLFSVPSYTLKQVKTSGLGTGAQISIQTIGVTQFDSRVILTNQEYAMLAYIKQVTDPNVMDELFLDAWAHVLGAGVCLALTGDKELRNATIEIVNRKIMEARKADGNEGLTINDVTPDWIRARGIAYSEYYSSPWSAFDWGAMWPVY